MAFAEQDASRRQDISRMALTITQKITDRSLGSFGELGPELTRVKHLAERLLQAPIDTAPAAHIDQLHRATASLSDSISKILDSKRPPEHGTHDATQFLSEARQFYTEAAPLFGYSRPAGETVEMAEREIQRVIDEGRRQLSGLVETLHKTTGEATQTLEAAKEAAQSYGISAQSQYFEKQAQEHSVNGRYWLWAATGITVVIVGVASFSAYYYLVNPPRPDASLNVQLFFAKLVLFSVLFTALVSSVRSYRAHRHNYIVNKHRQNALMTFRAFSSLANADPATKNAVLLQTTQCIFAPQPTGYSTVESEATYPPVLEFVKSLTAVQK